MFSWRNKKYVYLDESYVNTSSLFHLKQQQQQICYQLIYGISPGGGWVRRRCRVSYVTGHSTDIGLQLGKACYPCSR